MAEEGGGKTTWVFDLDITGVMKKAGDVEALVKNIGNEDNLLGLVRGFKGAALGAAALATALLAMKGTMALVFKAEELEAMNKQFDILTEKAGIAGDSLKAGLDASAAGLIDNNKLLEIANKSIVQLGSSAEKLPELMNVARKATAVFGGEFADNFERMAQAIASGNTKQLKNLGITIDQDKALRDYAKTLGITVDSLSETGRRQALMNAAIEQGGKSFDGVNTNLRTTNDLWTKFKNIVGDFADFIVEKVGKFIQPAVNGVLDQLNLVVGFWTKKVKSLMGEQKVAAQEAAKISEDQKKKEAVDDQKRFEQQSKFEADLLKLKQARLQSDQKNAQGEIEAARIAGQQKTVIAEEFEARIQELEAQRQQGKLTADQFEQMRHELQLQRNNALMEQERQMDQLRIDANNRWVESSTTAADGYSRAFQAAAMNARIAIDDWGKRGQMAVSSFQRHSTAAFLAVGEGSKTMGEAMKGFIFNTLADVVEQEGQYRLLLGIWPPNPLSIAAGAGLIALAGFLRSQAGGGGGGGGGAGAGAGGGGVAAAGGGEARPQMEEMQKKAVTINFQGDYLETDETKNRFVEMIRQASDATDFNINRIGG